MIQRIQFLDGLRGIGALIVCLSHIFYVFLLKDFPDLAIPKYIIPIFDGSYAVIIFFVVSGFSLSIHYFHKKDDAVLSQMAMRRYFRLAIPIFFSTLICYALLALDLMYNQEAAEISGAREWLIQPYYKFDYNFLGALRFAFYDVFFNYAGNTTYNQVLWTMPIEFFGSFFVFIILAIAGKRKIRYYVYVVVFSYFLWFNNPLAAFTSGIVLAEFHASSAKFIHVRLWSHVKDLLLILLFVLSVLYVQYGGNDGNIYMLRTISASVVVYCVSQSPSLRCVFESKVALFLGTISFPLYLLHMPIICSISSWLYKTLYGFDFTFITVIVGSITLVVCLVSAKLFYPIEKISITAGRYMSTLMLTYKSETDMGRQR